MCLHICIYIYIERERETDVHTLLYNTTNKYISLYIYIHIWECPINCLLISLYFNSSPTEEKTKSKSARSNKPGGSRGPWPPAARAPVRPSPQTAALVPLWRTPAGCDRQDLRPAAAACPWRAHGWLWLIGN